MNLDVFVTTACNMQCLFCGAWKQDNPNQFIELDKVFSILDAGKDYGFKYTTLSGGEPLMHPNILEIIDYANNKGFWINITTNGLLIDDKFLSSIKGKKVNIRVSFHSLKKELHNKITNGDTYDQLVATINRLKELRVYYSIGSTIFEENVDEIEQLAEFALKSNAAFIRYSPVVSILKGNGIKLDQKFHEEMLVRIIKAALKYKNYLSYPKKNLNLIGDPIDIMTTRRCPAGSDIFMIVDANQDIIPCQFFPSEVEYPHCKYTCCDDFKKLKNEMNGMFSEDFLDNLQGECKDCSFKSVCYGSCIGNKLTRGLKLTDEQPLCLRKIMKNALSGFSSKEMEDLMQYWYYHYNQRVSIFDRNKSCIRKLPIWELNFKYGIQQNFQDTAY
ncbi:MAG TPA: radical SAM protein [Clostridia bacterium]|nr:radical SAM protein [Clostridia bacterium]